MEQYRNIYNTAEMHINFILLHTFQSLTTQSTHREKYRLIT